MMFPNLGKRASKSDIYEIGTVVEAMPSGLNDLYSFLELGDLPIAVKLDAVEALAVCNDDMGVFLSAEKLGVSKTPFDYIYEPVVGIEGLFSLVPAWLEIGLRNKRICNNFLREVGAATEFKFCGPKFIVDGEQYNIEAKALLMHESSFGKPEVTEPSSIEEMIETIAPYKPATSLIKSMELGNG